MNINLKDILPKLIESAPVAVLYLDADGNVVLCNKKTKSIVGLKHTDIIGKNWLKVLFRDAASAMKKEMFKAVMDDSLINKRVKDFECYMSDNLGSQRLVSWNIAPILDENNQVQASALFGHDITEIEKRKNSIQNIDNSLRNILSNIKEYALYVINLDGFITYFGMGSEAMFGWNKSEIIFKHADILHNFDEASSSSGSNLELILEHVRLSGKYEAEVKLATKTGVVIPVILSVNQFLDSAGRLSGYIFIAKDMTERKKLEYQIFQAEKLAALGQLSAGMAHEISNPLFIISGRLEMLKYEKLSQNVSNSLSLIDTQTERIRKLVDRILKFSRKPTPAMEPVDINEIVESSLQLVNYNKLPVAKIEIHKSFEKNMTEINGDRHQLQEAFLNLLINAYQSMPKGGVIKIITSNFRNLYAQIQIIDTGVGIPPDNFKDIFMPFFSTKSDGTGLGLSICHNIIKNHNGSIELASQVNQGTTFTVRLPFI